MRRQRMGAVLLAILITSFALGYALSYVVQTQNIWNGSRKPALNTSSQEPRISRDTPITFEKEYILSKKVMATKFTNKEDLVGKSIAEIREKYSSANGFSITWQDKTLRIHQKVNDWSPTDKNKLRLKEYRGMVAVYRGPDADHDKLLKITAIKFNTLPLYIQEAIQAGQYEFEDEQSLNDALENMDEYI